MQNLAIARAQAEEHHCEQLSAYSRILLGGTGRDYRPGTPADVPPTSSRAQSGPVPGFSASGLARALFTSIAETVRRLASFNVVA